MGDERETTRSRVKIYAASLAVLMVSSCGPADPLLFPIGAYDGWQREREISIEPPHSSQQTTEFDIGISVDENNTVFLEGVQMDLDDLAVQLAILHTLGPDHVIVVRAHPGAKNGVLLVVRDAARAAKFEKINIVLDPDW